MDQPPPQSTAHTRAGVHVAVDVAHVGALWTRDPELSWEALNQLDDLIETMLDDFDGELVDVPGEAFIAHFSSVAGAVMWCARMQEGLLTLDWPATLSANFDASGAPDMLFGGLLARMAIHQGHLDTLRVLMTLSSPGQVLISADTWDTVDAETPPDLQVSPLGTTQLPDRPLAICQITTRLLSRRRFTPLPARTSRLPAEPDCFVGRLAALADLRERLGSGTRLVNITGDRGAGVTRLAMQWARRVEASGTSEVALVSLTEARDDTDLQLATASALELSLSAIQRGTLAERVGHAMAARGPVVLLFDGFPAALGEETLSTWLRTAPEAQLIITTDTPLESALATHQHLGPLSQADARALFLARTHRRLRGQNRPSHASAITVPDTLPTTDVAALEAMTGIASPMWDTPKASTMATRQRALNPELDPVVRIEAALGCVSALSRMGMSGVALDVLGSVSELIDATADPALQEQWTAARADVLIAAGEWEQAREIIDTVGSTDADWKLRRGRLALAESRFADAVEILRDIADHQERPDIALAIGLALAGSDEWEEATAPLEIAAAGLSQDLEKARAWAALGRVHADLGRATLSESALDKALALGQSDPHLVASVHHHRFESASARLYLEEASAHIVQAIATLTSCGDRAGTAQCLIHAGILSLVRHDPTTAKAQLDQACQISKEDGLVQLEARALLGQGIAARVTGDLGHALDAFAEAAALVEGDHTLAALIHAHRGATEAACDAIENAETAFSRSETHLESVWDALGTTIHDVLSGFVDLARARDAGLDEDTEAVDHHVDQALNRLARASSFETRSTPPRGREIPSRLNELRLARLLLDNALGSTQPTEH
jgi:tetratricopeptide (TPR) repeat protein